MNEAWKVVSVAVAALLLLTALPMLSSRDSGAGVADTLQTDALAGLETKTGLSPTKSAVVVPVQSSALNASMEIGNMTMSIGEGAVLRHLENLVSYKTRFTYTRQSLEAAEYIYTAFERCGLQVEYHDYVFGVTEHKNVIATLPGENATAPSYYLGAHYDSTSSQAYYNAPGADDDGTGVAAVLVAAEVLSQYRFNRTIVFCAFSGEEQGLLGSKAYARSLYEGGVSVGGAICLDMVGYNPEPADRNLYSRTNALSISLANFTHDISQKYPRVTINCSVKPDSSTNSDHAAFWAYAMEAVNFIETRYTSNPNYHKPTDTIDYLNMTYATNTTQLSVACMAELAEFRSADGRPPIFISPVPKPGGYSNETPVVGICAIDPSGVDPSTIRLYINGMAVAHSVAPISGGYDITHVQTVPFADGQVVAYHLTANDTLGNHGNYWWNTTVDGVGPTVPVLANITLEQVRVIKHGLVMDNGSFGSYDDANVINPSVMRDGVQLKMWYGAHDGTTYRIAYATSTNGVNWTKYGIVLDVGAAGQDDSRHVADCAVIKVGAEYKMWYSGHNGTSYRILYAVSADGVNWTKRGTAIDHGAPGSLDSRQSLNPSVLMAGAEYRMYYAGSDGLTYRILLATSADGENWTRRGVAIDAGRFGEYDCVHVQGPSVVQSGSGYLCWYMGYDGYRTRGFKARSTDGYNWTKMGISIDAGTLAEYDYVVVAHPCAVIEDNTVKIWYNGQNGYYRILYATMPESSGNGALKDSVALEWPSVGGEIDRYEVFVSGSWAECLSPPDTGWTRAQNGYFCHNPAGAGNNTTYYYALRSVDRVGHSGMHWTRAVKAAAAATAGWTTLGVADPGMAELARAFESVEWTGLMAWNASDASNHWRTNFTERPGYLNDLAGLWPMAGCWVKAANASTHAAVGLVSNVTVQLQMGWNLVSFPHVEQRTGAQIMAEVGPACSVIEGFDTAATYRLKSIVGTDTMNPGMAYWLYMTSATSWVVENY